MVMQIVGFGNVLLDFSVEIRDQKYNFLYEKYDLKINGQKEVDFATMDCLLNDIEKIGFTCVTPGGCAFNTVRLVQKLLESDDNPQIGMFFGAIGKDRNAEIMRKILTKQKLSLNLIEKETGRTGTCVSLINGESRSLVACLGASELLTLKDIEEEWPKIESELRTARFIYLEAFSLTRHYDIVKFVVDFVRNNPHQRLAFNLSGTYLYADVDLVRKIDWCVHQAHVLIGNHDEFSSYFQAVCAFDNKSTPSLEQFFKEKFCVTGDNTEKIFVITNGKKKVECFHYQPADRESRKTENATSFVQYTFEIPNVLGSDTLIRDTSGAGDAFASGFLAAYLKNKSIQDCLSDACDCARMVIMNVGCVLTN